MLASNPSISDSATLPHDIDSAAVVVHDTSSTSARAESVKVSAASAAGAAAGVAGKNSYTVDFV